MKRVLCAILALIMMAGICIFPIGAADEAGVRFEVDELYRSNNNLSKHPHTFEAWVQVDKNAPASELGVIAGNYKNSTTHSYGMEVRANGNPFLWLGYGGEGTNQRVSFDKVDLRTSELTHVAITFDAKNAYCYINGELKQTIAGSYPDVNMAKTGVLCIGGDLRSGNKRYLKNSLLSSVAVFADMRTADEIKADMTKVDAADADLLVSYDLKPTDASRLTDASVNKNDLVYSGKLWANPGIEEDKETAGMTFTSDTYELAKIIETPIKTLEATVYFPKSMPASERGGVIIGNYNSSLPCVNFEVYSDGSPRLYVKDKSNTTYNIVFDQINLFNGEWSHIAIVRDGAKLMCYINGELKQTVAKSVPDVITTDVHILGGDQRSGNEQYFRGRLKNVALYSDVRTADEIKADVTSAGKDGMICSFEVDGLNNPTDIEDKSGNGYNAKLFRPYFTEKAPLDKYAYSFAVIGDTQILAVNYPEKFTALYDWVLDNVESKNIKYVLGLGDITDDDTAAEWELAKKNITRMNGIVPYSLVRGNHDSIAMMRKYFPMSEFGSTVTGTYEANSIINSYHKFAVGDVKYLIFTLDYGAFDEVLDWASEIIEAHPDHNVIITTHAYLFRDGTTLDAGDVVPPSNKGKKYNNGDQIWDKLIRKHENIVLVLSGHDPCDNVVCTQTKGDNGNTVTQMLIDPQGVDKAQGGSGLVAMFYFSEDGKTLQVEYYSTDRKAYYLENNQFTVTLDLAEPKTEEATAEATEPVTEPETDPVETAPVTVPAETDAPEQTTAPAEEKKGCGAAVISPVFIIVIATGYVLSKRRANDDLALRE